MRGSNAAVQKKYRKIQRQGKQDLRFLSLMIFLGLLLYSALNYYVLTRLDHTPADAMKTYLVYAVSSLILWCVPLRMLWHYNRLGRYVYGFCFGISAYFYVQRFPFVSEEWTPAFFRILFQLLFGLKCAMLCYGGVRIFFSKKIRSIWNVYGLFDDELAKMEEFKEVKEEKTERISKKEKKAVMLLKRASLRLGFFLYFSVLASFMLFGILIRILPQYHDAIQAIQYPLFSECLFSVMVWSIPVIGMYLGKSWSPYLIYVALLGEALRLLLSYSQYVDLLGNQLIPIVLKLLWIVIEIMRFLLLFFSCRSALQHPYLRAYRRMQAEGRSENSL